MDFDYTPDQIQLRKDYRERLEAVMTPERRAAVAGLREGGAAITAVRRALGAAGPLGVPRPTELGGHGLGGVGRRGEGGGRPRGRAGPGGGARGAGRGRQAAGGSGRRRGAARGPGGGG